MKIELHLLQNFAPSNLNRDDTGAPKDCELGGHRRARISSQCQKRAVRQMFEVSGLVSAENRGARTKRLAHKVAELLTTKHGFDESAALSLATGAIEGVGLGRDKKGEGTDAHKTEYLLFIPRRTVEGLAAILVEHKDELSALVAPAATAEPADASAKKKKETKKDAKKDAKAAYPKEVQKKVEALLESARKTADVALFGRMIADKPEWNVDAACQVAQAISTNKVQMDFDFFTAVDDFKPNDNQGSDMMGTVQFNSSCFYRYAVLDVDALKSNLDGGDEGGALLQKTVDAFVRGFVSAIPTGKQNSMAANNFPSYALAIVRDEGQAISLANAFLKPARPKGDDVDLVDDSVAKLEGYLARMSDPLGKTRLAISWADRDVTGGEVQRAGRLDDFYGQVKAVVGASA